MAATAIILAGGKSSRMGKNKAMLPIDGRTNIERIKLELAPVFSEVILVANDIETYHFLNIPVVQDKVKEKGPLAGVQAGLLASNTDVNIIVACDMPFTSAIVANRLIELSEDYDAVVPVINNKKHPLFAVYNKSVLSKIDECLKNDRLRIQQLLDFVRVNYVTESQLLNKEIDKLDQVFYNMNHPEEYEEAIKIAKK